MYYIIILIHTSQGVLKDKVGPYYNLMDTKEAIEDMKKYFNAYGKGAENSLTCLEFIICPQDS